MNDINTLCLTSPIQLVKKVPPAGLLMADIGDISIRLLDYKRKRFVLKDISTIEVQFDDEADMNAVWEKVRLSPF